MSSRYRVRILCEDRRTERFLRRLCKAHDVRILDVEVAPSAQGAASAWVQARYARLVRQRRSRNFQAHLGLLVHIDGDNEGVRSRKEALDHELSKAGFDQRGSQEPIALFVPTWCIETWLLHLSGLAQPPETAQLKRDPDPTCSAALRALEASEAHHLGVAVGAWRTLTPAPPSPVNARAEASRIGLP